MSARSAMEELLGCDPQRALQPGNNHGVDRTPGAGLVTASQAEPGPEPGHCLPKLLHPATPASVSSPSNFRIAS